MVLVEVLYAKNLSSVCFVCVGGIFVACCVYVCECVCVCEVCMCGLCLWCVCCMCGVNVRDECVCCVCCMLCVCGLYLVCVFALYFCDESVIHVVRGCGVCVMYLYYICH